MIQIIDKISVSLKITWIIVFSLWFQLSDNNGNT